MDVAVAVIGIGVADNIQMLKEASVALGGLPEDRVQRSNLRVSMLCNAIKVSLNRMEDFYENSNSSR
jgi:hypothetical protein